MKNLLPKKILWTACSLETCNGVVSFFVEDGALYLEIPVDSGTMNFQRGGRN